MSESSSEDRKEAETPQDETPVDNVDSVDKTDATAATDHVMKHDIAHEEEQVAEAYHGEATTKKELWGWYDIANSTFGNTTMSAFLPAYLFLVAQQNEGDDHKFEFLPGIRLAGSSYYTTLTPILVALQALVILLLGTLGDFGNGRKKTLIISSVIGSVSGSLLIAVYNETFWLGGVLVIISNVGLGLSVVMYNAYLPIIVRNLPELRGKEDQEDFPELEQIAMNRVSSRGFILGYIAGVILLALNVGVALVSSRIVGGGSCNKWCVHCPTVEGNASLPGWNAYNYLIFNQTMIKQAKFCDNALLKCRAWPGINPPCGSGIVDVDIDKDGNCLNTQFWNRYSYSVDGARWSLNTSVANVTFEGEKADNLTDICTRPFTVLTENLSVAFPANETATNETIGLWAENQNGGCPFFHCSRALCSRNYDPNKCDPNHWGTRINVASGAIWWMFFAIFTYFWLKPRPAPPLPPGTTYVGQSLKRAYAAMKKIKRLRNTFLFLLSFWFSSDGYGTITVGSTIIAAQAPLFFGGLELGILLLEVNLVALFGSIFYERLSNFIVKRWRDKRIALGDDPETLDSFWIFRTMKFVNLAFLSLLPIWALPGVGLKTKTEFFIAAGIYGFQIGAIQSNSRMLMSHFTPVGCESEFFSFFELTDKGTAWLGPLVLTIANEQLDEMRWAVGIITFFFVISAIFLYFVDVKQGYIEALNFHITAELEMVEAKLKDPSIRIEEEDLSPEELEKRAIETRGVIAKGWSKQDLDQPGVLSSVKTKIGSLKADDDIAEQHLDLGKEPADLFTPRELEPTPPAEEAPAASEEEEEREPEEPPPRIKKKSKTDLNLDVGDGTGTRKRKKKKHDDADDNNNNADDAAAAESPRHSD